MQERNLVDYISWQDVSARSLKEKVFHLLQHPDRVQKAICNFELTGLDAMRRRIESFRNDESLS
jgi:hypothetical protein